MVYFVLLLQIFVLFFFFHPMLGMKPGALNILDRVGLMPSTLSSFKCLPEKKSTQLENVLPFSRQGVLGCVRKSAKIKSYSK